MGNSISFDNKYDDMLHMSNGVTNVFINILTLSGAAIAETESEKRLTVFLSEHDQRARGIGTVGFDISEMPWDKETFENDKQFILNIINGARNKTGWEKLNYEPKEEHVSHCLDTFENLINKMTADDIQEEVLTDWLSGADENDPVRCGFPRCEKHNTFLTCFGCQICNS